MPTQNKLRAKFAAGRKCLGVWSSVLHTVVTETVAAAGYDFVILDNEHGPSMPGDTLPHLQILARMDTATIVRVPWNDPVYLKRILDAGAESVMVPMVETAEQARAVVNACRYPPQGQRSFGPWPTVFTAPSILRMAASAAWARTVASPAPGVRKARSNT